MQDLPDSGLLLVDFVWQQVCLLVSDLDVDYEEMENAVYAIIQGGDHIHSLGMLLIQPFLQSTESLLAEWSHSYWSCALAYNVKGKGSPRATVQWKQ